MSDRLQQANEILALFEPHVRIERRESGRLWLVSELQFKHSTFRMDKAAVLSRDGSSLACRYGALGMGGTAAAATAMLIRWLRDETRLPLFTWEYWCGRTVRLAGDRGPVLLEKLRATDYGDPAKTCCVLCGSERIGDWYSLDGVVGPCCWGAFAGKCPGGRDGAA